MKDIKFYCYSGSYSDVSFFQFFKGYLSKYKGCDRLIETSGRYSPETNIHTNSIFFYYRDYFGELNLYGQITIDNEGSFFL